MTESAIQTAIMNMLLQHPSVAWAYVTSAGKVKVGKYWMTLGFPGLSDIIGQMKDGRLFAIEVKGPKGKASDKQLEFVDLVRRNKGLAGVARSVDEAMGVIG